MAPLCAARVARHEDTTCAAPIARRLAGLSDRQPGGAAEAGGTERNMCARALVQGIIYLAIQGSVRYDVAATASLAPGFGPDVRSPSMREPDDADTITLRDASEFHAGRAHAGRRGGDAQAPPATGCPDPAALDAYFTQAARDWTVPGFAVAIVKERPGRAGERLRRARGRDRRLLTSTPCSTRFGHQAVHGRRAGAAGRRRQAADRRPGDEVPASFALGRSVADRAGDRARPAGASHRPAARGPPEFGDTSRSRSRAGCVSLKPIAPLRTQFTYQNQMYSWPAS